MVSVELFCIQQRSVIVGKVLAACFAGFLLLLVFLVFWGNYIWFMLSKTYWNCMNNVQYHVNGIL